LRHKLELEPNFAIRLIDFARLKTEVTSEAVTVLSIETDKFNVIMSAAAGTNKGLIALPDVGDSILLLLSHNKRQRGVVLVQESGSFHTTPSIWQPQGEDCFN